MAYGAPRDLTTGPLADEMPSPAYECHDVAANQVLRGKSLTSLASFRGTQQRPFVRLPYHRDEQLRPIWGSVATEIYA